MATLTYRQLSLSVKYTSVLFPLDTRQFLRALSKQGFVLPEELGPVPFGARVEVSGIVGRKGEVSIRLDANKQVLGVHAPSLATVLGEMDSLESMLKSEFDLDSSSLAQYYELLAGVIVKARKDPLESWDSHVAEVPIIKRFSEVLGVQASPFGMRLAVKGEVPNQSNWLDVRIEPLVLNPRKQHLVEVIFRNSRRDEVFTFARGFEDTVRALISIVEEG